jgi:hypothetical protein
LPDLRTLRTERVWPGKRSGHWPSYAGRHHALVGPLSSPRLVLPGNGGALVRIDNAMLSAGLGRSRYVRGLKRLTPLLLDTATALVDGIDVPRGAERYLPALEELAGAAAAGTLVFGIGRDREIVAVQRPRVRLDQDGRLHDWDGHPAVWWPGEAEQLYFWRGVHMTATAGRSPDEVTARRALGWANAECRRVSVERLGWDRVLADLRAELRQQDDFGRLWRIPARRRRQPSWGRWAREPEPVVVVEVVNATVEHDGTRRRYFLVVPPSTRTAREAVAWSFGFESARNYRPAVET